VKGYREQRLGYSTGHGRGKEEEYRLYALTSMKICNKEKDRDPTNMTGAARRDMG